MPLDAGTAAIIGAAVGAGASTFAALITANVTRSNIYKQHLYVKRAEAYDDACRALSRWHGMSRAERDDLNLDIINRLTMYGAVSVLSTFDKAANAHDFLREIRDGDVAFEPKTTEMATIAAWPDLEQKQRYALHFASRTMLDFAGEASRDSHRFPRQQAFRAARHKVGERRNQKFWEAAHERLQRLTAK